MVFFNILFYYIIYYKYLDQSVLENYHVSETFKVILNDSCNILENFTNGEFRVIRKRMISCILATDMTHHFKHLHEFRTKLQLFEISEGKNIERFIDNHSINDSQQMILDNTIHLSDISNPSKNGLIYDKWVDLVLVEFFNQGDMEKKSNLPISFLCDRTSTTKPKSQMGFMVGIVKPYFELYCNLVPEIKPYIDNLDSNFERYRKMELEDEMDKNK